MSQKPAAITVTTTTGRNELDSSHTYDNASVFTNDSASIRDYTLIPTSGNDDTCSGVHATAVV